MIGFFNHGTQGTATGSQLSFVPQISFSVYMWNTYRARSQKPEDARYPKKYIRLRLEAPGVRAKDMIPNFAIIGNCGLGESAGASRLKAPIVGGGVKNPGQVAHTTRSLILVPPMQSQGGVQSFLT